MKSIFYFLIFAVFLITSCKEDEAPSSYLDGTYENTGFNPETGISYVSQYIFSTDGTFERISLLRQNGQLLGYNFYSSGSYTLRVEKFTIRTGKMAGVNYQEYPDGYVPNLDQLEEYKNEFTESNGILRQLEGGEKVAILMDCNDTIGFSSLCIGELVYDKVD